MDAAQSVQEHQMKMVELGARAGAEQNKARLGATTEFMKLQSKQAQDHQGLITDAIRNAQRIRHDEEMHRQRLSAVRAKANGGAR
jgi:hypothetical protein